MKTKREVCEVGRKLVESAVLSKGAHGSTFGKNLAEPCEVCVMELRAQVGALCGWFPEVKTDFPKGDSRCLSRFLHVINDRCTDEQREELKQFVLLDLSKKSDELEVKRIYRCADWAVREVAVRRFKRIGREDLAEKFAAFDPITDKVSAQKARADADAAAAAYAAADADAAAAADAAAYAAADADAAAAAYAAAAADAAAAAYAAAAAAAYADAAAAWQATLAFVHELIEMEA